jgi:pyruvate/2-oxoglutarate dehydrogenase complex dihydrolipoamide acyltransferase (E2) component
VAKVTMPQLGESVAEGTIGKWLKQPGDHVEKYEPLLEVITDKVNAEVPSPFEGVLKEILAEEGATVPNNAEIAIIETSDDGASGDRAAAPEPAKADVGSEASADAPKPADVPKPAADDAPPPDTAVPPEVAKGPAGSDESVNGSSPTPAPVEAAESSAPAAERPAAAATAAPPTAQGDPEARMTPAVRRLLREHGLSPEQITGTGGGGRITRDDVLAVVEAIRTGKAVPAPAAQPTAPTPTPAAAPTAPVPTPAAAPAPTTAPAAATARPGMPTAATVEFPEGTDEVLVPMTQMRKGIAAQMTRALQAPHAYVQMEVDATRLVALRERAKKAYQAKEGISLSYVPFVVKAAAEALKRNPTFNAHWTDEGLVAKRRVNIGVAVAVDDGLLVPVIRDADTLSIHGLNLAITDVANRARVNKFRVDDFGGGTFTVDNTGYLGTNLVMPILNVPEVGIVTMEAITKRPVVQSTPDGDVIAIRPVMNMVLGVDHRANDGAGGAALLRDIKAWLEAVGPDTPLY